MTKTSSETNKPKPAAGRTTGATPRYEERAGTYKAAPECEVAVLGIESLPPAHNNITE